ncbi:hypothetical protein [Paraburkholderia sp. MM5496-R1]|uniref:hypothetical protein n=1 Tax=Paraburkholderia sp. MM5496-R1 TaxID=2991065 RepID=UPI003D21654A
MADSVASPQSMPPRVASKKQRQGAVSTETENKLARAARSAQRLAQLSGVARDDSTLDLFPDDPTRATLEAMNIDVRQGTLHGFELPDVVLQAVGVFDEHGLLDKTARRAPRAAKLDAPMPVNGQLSGFDVEPVMAVADASANKPANEPANEPANGAPDGSAPNAAANTDDKPAATSRESSAPLSSAMAAATVARSVTALRQAAEAELAATAGAGKPQQRFAATFAKAATASRDAAAATATASLATSAATDGSSMSQSADEPATRTQSASPEAVTTKQDDKLSATALLTTPRSSSADNHAGFATSSRDARRTDAAAAALRSEPELDRARATAFADTVDALYGVIADQRRAATDHSRRVKWMLSIVVGALLVTVAIGIAQTLLLMRLTRETTAQQHRIEQMMQNQQAAMVSLLDAHAATANAASAAAATTPTAAPPAAPLQPSATPTRARHARASHRRPPSH